MSKYFADEYGHTAATGIADPSDFAVWLGIEFALTLDKSAHVNLSELDRVGYERSHYNTSLSHDAGPIDTIVHVYHGPVHYEDHSGRIDKQEQWFDPFAGPKAWFTKRKSFEIQSEYRFAVTTLGDPVHPRHYIFVSEELRALTCPLWSPLRLD